MKITLTRYYQDRYITKSRMSIDGEPFCEAREPGTQCGSCCQGVRRPRMLKDGTYSCKCVSSDDAPMTLAVCQTVGHNRITFGWHPLQQWKANRIFIGEADPYDPPAERELREQESTFAAFAHLLYRAYGTREAITLTVNSLSTCLATN